jgi:hypothetical protein
MTIIHVVFFEWKPSTSHAQVEEVGGPTSMTMSMLTSLSKACKRMLALKDDCLSTSSQKPYIKSFSGGRNNSPEGHAVRKICTRHGSELIVIYREHSHMALS